eukprot:m.60361 g.60361  ORF g.60361 m.60361 type:complete len:238 (-) comp22831_c1_seq1:48-761(-)
MSSSAALKAMAMARAAPPPDVQVAKMRKDKVAAMKLARLKAKANARGAAPPPPGKGGAPPPPITTTDGAPPKIEKYRALEDHEGEIKFPIGATLFVLGDADKDGNVVGVYDGESGNVPLSKLAVITPELLEKERVEKEAMWAEARAQKEKEMTADMAKIEAEELAKLKALEQRTGDEAPDNNEDEKLAALAKAAADKKISDEIAGMKAEEDKLLAEAKRLEELMAALDMDDDEDDAL